MVRRNKFSIIIAFIIIILSLTSSEELQKISIIHFKGMDKVIHFIMYFVFMSVILFENRKRVGRTGNLFLIALIPFFFGALMELLQSLLTSSRSGSIYDLIFNLAGILFSVLIFLIIRSFQKEKIK
ncbi:MAG: VanZ family protein [Bacteroidia bacterium]|nr:VanZ family protein [Bacteroidia bacterium]